MKRTITYHELNTIQHALAHFANAYALNGNYSKSNQLNELGERLLGYAQEPDEPITIVF